MVTSSGIAAAGERNTQAAQSLPAHKSTEPTVDNDMAERLEELAQRCEAATGPDRELDIAIGLTGMFYIAKPRYPGAEPMIGYVDENGSRVEPGNDSQDSLVPRYTASIAAAMTLVPVCPRTGGNIYAARLDSGFYGATAELWHECASEQFHGHAPGQHDALPRALAAAALRARAQIKGTET